MFRKPRDVNDLSPSQVLGRPPSPTSSSAPPHAATSSSSHSNAARGPMGNSKLPLSGVSANRRTPAIPKVKGKATGSPRPNGSILSFFKKVDSPLKANGASSADSDSLFFEDQNQQRGHVQEADVKEINEVEPQIPTPPEEDEPKDGIDGTRRFNESEISIKRRKIGKQLLGRSLSPAISSSPGAEDDPMAPQGDDHSEEAPKDTSTFDGDVETQNNRMSSELDSVAGQQESHNKSDAHEEQSADSLPHEGSPEASAVKVDPDGSTYNPSPTLERESTSFIYEDDVEDYINEDELAELGEEFLERRYAAEQRRLEREAGDSGEEWDDGEQVKLESPDNAEEALEQCTLDEGAPPCPICNIALAGITAEQASTHVNNCLDGRPTSLPKPAIEPAGVQSDPPAAQKRFIKAAIARPGQQNPFHLGQGDAAGSGGSAFTKLMSNHAEDTAWATAAANEVASRGKPAFKRTCPFYKILPGFNICVDAFRYGAVQGCNAYFLSHFHSDHYIGLTSSWCHGPIYCSKVTANLVKQQLRVNPTYVVALDFEKKIEVPGTRGVHVTMIPANHCPGSSLFLYEKELSKGKKPRLQRVLHCGDFRACPMHVRHPLLRPDVVDAVTGNGRQQKLDVCYLDTTYLTPKYAFPLQHEVIQACSDMCVSLSKELVDTSDAWERTKRERAGAGMVKFVRGSSVQQEKELDEDGNAMPGAATESATKRRGRLLVIVGTYSIGKERICLGIAKALNSKIYASAGKQRICAALEDPELTSRLTSDPLEAQVHMQMIMEIRAETLSDYLQSYKPHFSRIVGFRPSGWNYRPPNSRFTESPLVQTVLHGENWKSRYSMHELMPQRGSTKEASCFGVPYSEHSSFRELTMFCCALRIDRIIPTVNIGSAKSRDRMKGWIEKWEQDKRKHGLYKIGEDQTVW